MSKHIILIGYRAVGKSSVAQLLGKKLQMPIVSTDQEIEKRVGNIETYISAQGWEKFRDIESKVLEEMLISKRITNCIIDTGGGIVEREENCRRLRQMGTICWLRCSVEVLQERLKKTQRPSLTGTLPAHEEVGMILKTREKKYKNLADWIMMVDGKDTTRIVDAILKKMDSQCKIVASIGTTTLENIRLLLKRVPWYIDLVELRLDMIQEIAKEKDATKLQKIIREIITKSPVPVIITNRRKAEGGLWTGSEESRIRVLESARDLGATYIDIEWTTPQNLRERLMSKRSVTEVSQSTPGHFHRNRTQKIILSYHAKKAASKKELEDMYQQMQKEKPDLMKIVMPATNLLDNLRLFGFVENKHNIIAFCSGIHGQISRILAPKYGSWATYGYFSGAEKTAEGQYSVDELWHLYHCHKINRQTKVYGIIGLHAEHSLSMYIHNAGFYAHELNNVYVPFKIGTEQELHTFLRDYRRDIEGGSVTTPYKERIQADLDSIDITAKKIGAVNTIVREGKKCKGTNTDWYGALQALKEKTRLRGKKVLLIGAGGAAKAIIYGLLREKAEVSICNRTSARAKELAREWDITVIPFTQKDKIAPQYDIIIQATTIGMVNLPNQDSLLTHAQLHKDQIVMDIVYNSEETNLIKHARSVGCTVITGERMLLYQAKEQFRIWTGKDLETEATQNIIHNTLVI
ncbi:shikimate dehydrogenase [Candidatus Woesearchaeota archaeon]|nr:shikimate dehydrogenase [Candidatus Woesearchaeota archaeon]